LSLGRFVQQRHAAGDGRIAILNVSNVPMQAAAFGLGRGARHDFGVLVAAYRSALAMVVSTNLA
jgi:hypothetical protein